MIGELRVMEDIPVVVWPDDRVVGAHLMVTTTTIADAARRLSVHPNTVRKWIRQNRLDAVRTPLGDLVSRASLAWLVRARATER